jgi:hypothetical protein
MLWRDARQELVARRSEFMRLAAVVMAVAVVLNLPWWPNVAWWPESTRAFLTGVLLTGCAWVMAWIVWVTSGLGFRLNGVWAEEATTDECRRHPHALGVLASYKFERFDIDTVLVTRAAVYAVETKWQSRRTYPYRPERDARQLQADVRRLREDLGNQLVPQGWIRGVLLIRGPGSIGVGSHLVDVGHGEFVRVVSEAEFGPWLDGQGQGKVGPGFAADLVRYLETTNAEREAQLEASRTMRWIARTR